MSGRWYLTIGFLGLVVDQIVKWLVMKSSLSYRGVFIIDDVFGFGGRLNPEFAWGLPVANEYAAALSLVILIGLIIYGFRRRFLHSSLALIFAGAVSNLIDRFIFGGVIDYVLLPAGGATNLADVMIVVGMILLFINDKCQNPKFKSMPNA